ncbi:MAG: hypothetical protein AB1546_15460 [bacterium]
MDAPPLLGHPHKTLLQFLCQHKIGFFTGFFRACNTKIYDKKATPVTKKSQNLQVKKSEVFNWTCVFPKNYYGNGVEARNTTAVVKRLDLQKVA